jgi:hypothetical protein
MMTMKFRSDGRFSGAVLAAIALLALARPLVAQSANGHCAANLPSPPTTPPVTPEEICATIAVLADDSLEGRRAGTATADQAARWIAERFEATGLEPLDEASGFLRPFTFPEALLRDPHAASDATGRTLASANVAGMIRGTAPELSDQAIVIGAHYDHLGHGGLGSLAPGDSSIHNGADDNASGVAGVLELAGWFAVHPQPRTLIFAAFGAEELGDIGSAAWVKDPPWPLDRTVAMVNLDMVGRLRETLTVQGTGTSSLWPALLDSLASDSDLPSISRVPDGFGPSDHASFYGARIPVLALFTGAHDEYHRPTDDLETIDAEGETRVLALATRIVEALGDGREVPYAEAPVTQRRAAAFKVGLGVIPDYGYADGGLRLASVRPDGPAAAAGLQAGDVVVRLAGLDVADIYAYTEILGGLEADVPIEAVVLRGEERITTTVRPEPR